MKKYLLIFIILSCCSISFAQSDTVTTLLSYPDADISNPSFLLPEQYYELNGDLVFEKHQQNKSNIHVLFKSSYKDSTSKDISITNNNYKNMNPVGILLSTKNFPIRIFYQTNRNGNWDIVYKDFDNDSLSAEKFLASSGDDETNPSLVELDQIGRWMVLYEKDNSVFLASNNADSISTQKIFDGNDTVKYLQPVGKSISGWQGSIFFSAIKISNSDKVQLVGKKIDSDGKLTEERIIDEDTSLSKPHFSRGNNWDLFYEKNDGEFINEFYVDYSSDLSNISRFKDSIKGNYSNLSTISFPILGKQQNTYNSNYTSNFPYSYKFSRNDSNWIGYKSFNANNADTLIITKYFNSRPILGTENSPDGALEFPIVWPDSVNDRIGLKQVLVGKLYTNVNDKYFPKDFTLSQNYPNPFNPNTSIKFHLSKSAFVTINVYDILGRKIATLVNDYKTSGDYKTIFNASKFSSGVYFYQIELRKDKQNAVEYSQTKKMILLK